MAEIDEGPAQTREELLRRIDEIWDRRYEIEVEPPPRLKAMVDSQGEFFARMEALTGRPIRRRRR
jgi:hypothetical protein